MYKVSAGIVSSLTTLLTTWHTEGVLSNGLRAEKALREMGVLRKGILNTGESKYKVPRVVTSL